LNIEIGKEYHFVPTTDMFLATVVRELGDDEKDPEVGPMYEITIHAYPDELSEKEEDNAPSEQAPA